jgi:Domain of unknown function (DUF4390)
MPGTMGSTMPCSRKSERWRALLLGCALCFGPPGFTGTAADEGIHVKSAEISKQEEEHLLEANFSVELTPTLEDALNKGLPLHFVVEFELIEPRWYTLYLWNKSVYAFEQRYRLSYNALTRQYRLSFGALHQNIDTLAEVLALLGRLRPRALGGELDADAVYEAQIRLRLDGSQLPRPLQIDALASRDWYLASEWFRWTFKP